MNEKQLVKK